MSNINNMDNINNSNFYDFNTADKQFNYELIPAGTIAKVIMRIKAGGYDDPARGWTLGYATQNPFSGAVYLSCEFTIMQGEHSGRKIWQLIGLHSDKNNNRWGSMGRSFIRSILNSAKGFSDRDNSETAITARKISSLGDLDGLEFVAKIDQEKDSEGNYKNVIKYALDIDHAEYAKHSGQMPTVVTPSWM